MKFAYADPPYVGCARLYPEKTEVDHVALIDRLVTEYPDGWALSCSSPSLRYLLPLCPNNVRVMAWVKPFAVFKANVGLAYAWEPVIFHGGRRIAREQPTVRDWFSARWSGLRTSCAHFKTTATNSISTIRTSRTISIAPWSTTRFTASSKTTKTQSRSASG